MTFKWKCGYSKLFWIPLPNTEGSDFPSVKNRVPTYIRGPHVHDPHDSMVTSFCISDVISMKKWINQAENSKQLHTLVYSGSLLGKQKTSYDFNQKLWNSGFIRLSSHLISRFFSLWPHTLWPLAMITQSYVPWKNLHYIFLP